MSFPGGSTLWTSVPQAGSGCQALWLPWLFAGILLQRAPSTAKLGHTGLFLA